MRALDWAVVIVYLTWIVWSGLRAANRSKDADGYFRASRSMPWWDEDAMAGLFSPGAPASLGDIQGAYDQLAERFRTDLYVTHQTRPLLTTQPCLENAPRTAG